MKTLCAWSVLLISCFGQGNVPLQAKSSAQPVTLTISISDKKGKPVIGITRESLTVTSGDSPPVMPDDLQPSFDGPISFVIAVDESGSSRDKAAIEKKYAAQIFDVLTTPANRGYLVLFSETVRKSTELPSRDAFSQLLSRMQSHGGTALYDAVSESVQLLQTPGTHRMLFIISDGDDNYSKIERRREALSRALQSGVQIFCIGVMSAEGMYGEAQRKAAKKNLEELSDYTGGRALIFEDHPDNISKEISKILHSEFTITFTPTVDSNAETSQPLWVETKDPHMVVRFPARYFVK